MGPAGGATRGRKRTKTVNGEPVQKKPKHEKVSHRSHTDTPGCVMTLGQGDTGQLGLGPDVMERSKPGKVQLPDNIVQICAGGMHTVCVTADGEVYTFGCNDEGALGRLTPDEDDCMDPGKVELPNKVVQVSAGDSHTAAITDTGTVMVWGTFRDANGRIGLLEEDKTEPTPVQLRLDHKVVKVASGVDHLVCLTDEGEVYTCGCAEQGALGRVAECFSHRGGRKGIEWLLTPGPVHCKKRSVRFSDIWSGQYDTFAQVQGTGDIYAWGLNNYYQLGFNDMKNRFVPEKSHSFNSGKQWTSISGGQHHTLALDNNGTVYSLGRHNYGRLGLGEDVKEKAEPTVIKMLEGKKCVGVDCGTAVSIAVADDGTVYAWGMGTSKQLGQSDEDDEYEPVVMKGKQLENRSGLMVSAGGQHTVLLAKDK